MLYPAAEIDRNDLVPLPGKRLTDLPVTLAGDFDDQHLKIGAPFRSAAVLALTIKNANCLHSSPFAGDIWFRQKRPEGMGRDSRRRSLRVHGREVDQEAAGFRGRRPAG
ncbi:MAG: hypothetical protein BJ554DRAFT_1334 [Olpidium bornovanus]|uniref:Uncharacterized protein n=1 Tax=Olpidium bornovanus TaxID=278681 RepID=A0A8H7ZSG2_9FUNG|nr:MAG: hypothetical protein BJ554DRAFT_1334 [Olpidium bornovanus]